jgi:hypothetical protein|tara:strand:- start:36 stop:242 length:207 start_codon:yes stop_codon:yes gene_type:complete
MLSEIDAMLASNSFFVGWGTLALINSGLAQGKGRKGLHWFLLSTLLGPVATFFLVISEKLPETIKESS